MSAVVRLIAAVSLLAVGCSGGRALTSTECDKSCTNGKCIETSGKLQCYCGVRQCENGCNSTGEACASSPGPSLQTCATLSCPTDQKCVATASAGASCQPKECADLQCSATQKCLPPGAGLSARCAEKTCEDLACPETDKCLPGPPAQCTKKCTSITCDVGYTCASYDSKPTECVRLPGGDCTCTNGYCRQDQAGAAKSCVPCPTEVEPNDGITGGPPAGALYSQQRFYKPEQATQISVCGIFKFDTPANDGTHNCVQPDCVTTAASTTCPVGTSVQACSGGVGGNYCPYRLPSTSTPACFDGTNVSSPKGGALADNPSDAYALEEWDTFVAPCLPGYRYKVEVDALDAGAGIDRIRIFEARSTPDGAAQVVQNGSPLSLSNDYDFFCPPSSKVAVAMRPLSSQAGKRLMVTVKPNETYKLCAGGGPVRTCTAPQICVEAAYDLVNGSACVNGMTGPPALAPSENTADSGCTAKFFEHGLSSGECFASVGAPVRAAKGCLCGEGTADQAAVFSSACNLSGLQLITGNQGGFMTAQFGPTFNAGNWMDWWRATCVPGRTLRITVNRSSSGLQPAITVIGASERQSYSTCLDSDLAPANGSVTLDYTCDALRPTTVAGTEVGTAYDVYVAVHPTDASNPGTPDPTNKFNYSISTSLRPVTFEAQRNYLNPLVGEEYRTSAFCKNFDGTPFRLAQRYPCR